STIVIWVTTRLSVLICGMMHPAGLGGRNPAALRGKTPRRRRSFGAPGTSRASTHLGRPLAVEFTHRCEPGVGTRLGKAEIHGHDAELAHRAQVVRSLRRAAREQMPVAVVDLGGDEVAVPVHPVGKRDPRAIAAGLLDQLAQSGDSGAIARERIERMGGI